MTESKELISEENMNALAGMALQRQPLKNAVYCWQINEDTYPKMHEHAPFEDPVNGVVRQVDVLFVRNDIVEINTYSDINEAISFLILTHFKI